jgi:two-component system, sensor histidine kinase
MVIQSIRLRFQNAELIGELTLQKRVAEQASVAKTRFLAAASHDLRQPVQAIELLVDALGEDLANHPSRGLLDRIQEAGHGLRNLLNALLDSAKINAAAITAKPRHIQLAPLLKRICNELATQAQHKGLDIRVAKTKACVYTDPALLELILRNYVENAIKYTPEGRVLIGCRKQGGQIRIEVHDTGIGIPASAQETVFQEFYQLGNPERDKAKGLGLGLYIAHSLGKLLNHDIGVNSTVGKGSMFYVTVPQGDTSHLMDEPSRVQAGGKTPLTGKTVLLIDDDDLVRASVTEMLSRWQCSTIAAEDAETALRILMARGRMPDAIVADYRLRNKSTGVQAIQSLQAQLGNVPAVILTGDTAPSRIQEARNSGFLILHKPLSGVQLRSTLSELMSAKVRG